MNPWRFLQFSWFWDWVSSNVDYRPLLDRRVSPPKQVGCAIHRPLRVVLVVRTVRAAARRHRGLPRR